jgi:deoxyadenosine/deoxycytidine kinase
MVLKIFSLDGNIGSGKSTLIHLLKENQDRLQTNIGREIIFLQEPVDDWKNIVDENNKNLIENYYTDQKKWGFSFQITTLISRISQLKNVRDYGCEVVVITERSISSDKNVFCKMLYDDNIINTLDYNIYNKWYNEFIKDYPLVGNIYLKTNPKTAYERVLKRNRNEEEGIPMEYLSKCNDYHENWLMNEKNKLIINGNIDIDKKDCEKKSKYTVNKPLQLPSKWLSDVETYLQENI